MSCRPLAPARSWLLGISITDGFATSLNNDQDWPALLATRLAANKSTAMLGVPNLGISGNRVLRDGAGTNALARFDRDALSRAGVRWMTLLEGINDITFSAISGMPPSEAVTAEDLIWGYRQIIAKAQHARYQCGWRHHHAGARSGYLYGERLGSPRSGESLDPDQRRI